MCLFHRSIHQGRPQADAQDARASTKLMDLEVCLSNALLETLVLAYSAIYDRFYFHFFFISRVLDSKLCHEMAAVRLASGPVGGAFMQFCSQPWGQKHLHHYSAIAHRSRYGTGCK